MKDFAALWARVPVVDSPLALVLAVIAGLIVGFMIYGADVPRTQPYACARRFFLGATVMQAANSLVASTRAHSAAQALGPLLWIPLWALFSVGLLAGILLRQRQERSRRAMLVPRSGHERRKEDRDAGQS